MTTVVMPQLGESVMEGTVVRWIAKPGQRVERDEPLVEIATDKANTEVPSPTSGVLVETLAKEGAVVPVGSPLARLEEGGAQQPSQPAPSDGVRASPVGRNVAQEHGVDLNQVQGSGSGGKVTKADVISYLEKGAPQGEMQPSVSTFPGQKAPTAPPPPTQPPLAPAVSPPPA